MKNAHRVLMIGWELPPHNSGGLGIACANLSQALAREGTVISFTLPYSSDQDFDFLELIDCQSAQWGRKPRRDPPFRGYERAPRERSGSGVPGAISPMELQVQEYSEKVLQFARAHSDSFDLVHAHDWMGMPAAIKIKQELGKPFVAHIHSTEYDRSLSHDLGSFISRCELAGMTLASRVIAVSYYSKRLLVEKYKITPEKIDVVHNGVARILQGLAQVQRSFAYRRPVVVFMGRLTVQKGPDYFLDLAGKVLEKRSDVLFIVAGMGDMYQQLLFTNAGKALSANVLFSGFVRGGAQLAIMKRADVFVMPSVSEPFGLVATEAAALGVPVIASKNAGVIEILKGSPQFDFWNSGAMAQEVLHLLNDQAYRQKVVLSQQENIQGATWKKAAKKVQRVYQKVKQKKTAARKTKTKRVTKKTKRA